MGEGLYILLAIAIGLYLLVGPGLGMAAFFRGSGGTATQLAGLHKRIDDLSAELAALRRLLAGLTGGDAAPLQEDAAAPTPPQPSAAAVPSLSSPPTPSAPEQAQDEVPPVEPPAPRPAALAARREASIEQWLTSRGLIWLGGVTLALAGLFLAKYSYERGWLAMGPGARVTSGFIFGLALTVAGEWLRRRPLQRAIAAIGPNYLPPALTAAGLFSAFGSLYAAYGLYDLLSPLTAFALMALVAFAAFGLAILQGPFIAVLALLGGFATPLLVASPDPSAWALFAYLLVLTATALAIVRYMACWWLAWGALTGAVVWPLFWLVAVWSSGDAAALGSYVVLMAAVFLAVRYGAGEEAEHEAPMAVPDRIAWAGALATALLGFVLLRMDGYGAISLTAVFLLVCLYLAAAWREAVFEGLAIVGAVLVAAFMSVWHLPAIVDWPERAHSYQGQSYGTDLGPVIPPALTTFVFVALAFGALFAVVGFFALARARRPAIWAAVSAAVPVLLLAVAFWRVTGLGIDLAWSAAAVGVAALGFVAAAQLQRRPPRAG